MNKNSTKRKMNSYQIWSFEFQTFLAEKIFFMEHGAFIFGPKQVNIKVMFDFEFLNGSVKGSFTYI